MIYNETMKVKKLTLNVTFEETKGDAVVAVVPSLPGCTASGKDIHETRRKISSAIESRIISLEKSAIYKKKKDWFVGWIDEVPGANTQGKTLAEARKNMREALLLVLGASMSPLSAGQKFTQELLKITVPA
jgi:predicted RNase H-like HicB family nuclease